MNKPSTSNVQIHRYHVLAAFHCIDIEAVDFKGFFILLQQFCFCGPLQMQHSEAKTQCREHFPCFILAAKVLNLGLRHARPRVRHQCGHNASATRYKHTLFEYQVTINMEEI